jgi:hypothetical protein
MTDSSKKIYRKDAKDAKQSSGHGLQEVQDAAG